MMSGWKGTLTGIMWFKRQGFTNRGSTVEVLGSAAVGPKL